MGCDIHFFAEVRRNGKWEFLPAPNDGYDSSERRRIEKEGGKYECAHPYRLGVVDPNSKGYVAGYDNSYVSDPPGEDDNGGKGWMRDWFDDRNYTLFGMLANVRNGTGFAGCDTGDAVEPILPASVLGKFTGIPHTRGWPGDCCPELKEEGERIEHTPSWLTVAEMKAYFERKHEEDVIDHGTISGAEYEAFRDRGERPTSWSGGIFGQDIVTLSSEAYDSIPSEQLKRVDDGAFTCTVWTIPDHIPDSIINGSRQKRVYVRAQWTTPFSEYTSRFEACLEEMLEAAQAAPEDVRAVFYFDS